MPKKFKGENTKAKQARDRQDEAKQRSENEKRAKAEDASWQDDDRLVKKKQLRKDEKDLKEQEKLRRRQELQKLKDEEEVVRTEPKEAVRITRAQIQTTRTTTAESKAEPIPELLLVNPNKLKAEAEHEIEARSVEAAFYAMNELSIGGEEPMDKHPEKRMRAAYSKFEAENLNRLKAENPSLRLTQLKQMLAKQWASSPDNPKNCKK